VTPEYLPGQKTLFDIGAPKLLRGKHRGAFVDTLPDSYLRRAAALPNPEPAVLEELAKRGISVRRPA